MILQILFPLLFCFIMYIILINLHTLPGQIRLYKHSKQFINDLKYNPDKFEYYVTSWGEIWLNVKGTSYTISTEGSICFKQGDLYLYNDLSFFISTPFEYYLWYKIRKQLKLKFPKLKI